MWRRTYLLLLLVRVYFALSPSYLHPDEIFQGPEVISGSVFPYPVHRTWEWTSDHPIRSVFPIWLFYGVPMSLLKSIWTREEDALVDPAAIYYALRLVMFVLSFVLEDWAIYELVLSPRRRKQVVLLVASSYVTWTFQTHTFSNSLETLLVLWCLVLMERILKAEKRTSAPSCSTLGFLLVLGVFNRVTFPAFLLIPGLRMLPHFYNRPLSLLTVLLSATVWITVAVATDTAYYTGSGAAGSFRALFSSMRSAPVLTIVNNLNYNTQTSNLAHHGLHPHYQHILVGAGMYIIEYQSNAKQFKTYISRNRTPRTRNYFWTSWILFNVILGILMGIYHQGGIIPAQIAMPSLVTQSLQISQSDANAIEVFWWKTYPPPTYLIGTHHNNPRTAKPLNISVITLMGQDQARLYKTISDRIPSCKQSLLGKLSNFTAPADPEIYLVAPLSAWRFDRGEPAPSISDFSFDLQGEGAGGSDENKLCFEHLSTYRQHLNLDDMDFGDDGIGPTLSRVIGRRGLGVWHVRRVCDGV